MHRREYLAAFQKTVAMHETFLIRLAGHPAMRDDENFKVFLEFDKDVRPRVSCVASIVLTHRLDAEHARRRILHLALSSLSARRLTARSTTTRTATRFSRSRNSSSYTSMSRQYAATMCVLLMCAA